MGELDQKKLREKENLCHQDQPSRCTAACPLHLDGRALAAAVAKGDYQQGRAIVEQAIPFPRIISSFCEAPCAESCKRQEVGDGINLRGLEEACFRYGKEPKAKRTFLPKKKQKVAVVGSDLSGLHSAVELARKGYKVTLFYWSDSLVGGIDHGSDLQGVEQGWIEQDLVIIEKLSIQQQAIDGWERKHVYLWMQEYDGVYLSNGAMRLKGAELEGKFPFQYKESNLFISYQHGKPARYIDDLLHGKQVAISIDRFLQSVSLHSSREKEGAFESRLYTSLEGIEPRKKVQAESGAYSDEEAKEEAQRCLQCECLECVKACPYLAHYKGYPKTYAREIYNNLSIAMGNHTANGLINSCTLCGQCKVICPNGFDLAEVCLQARENMVENRKMPPSTHEFALLDLAFSNNEEFFLVRHQPDHQQSKYAFFPGCQLGASSPKLVKKVYGQLTEQLRGGVGLILGCCGAIARWAGQKDVMEQEREKLVAAWKSLDEPILITACPTCQKVLGENDTIPMVHVVDVISLEEQKNYLGAVAIQDPCGARENENLQQQIRNVVHRMGYQVEELPYGKERSSCCGYGGLTSFANREVAEKMTQHLVEQSVVPYVTYCINCRDRLQQKGKDCQHILELIYDEPIVGVAGLSQRRKNRIQLNRELRMQWWKESLKDMELQLAIEVAPEVLEQMEGRMILLSDVEETLLQAEENGNIIYDSSKGCYFTSYRKGNVTFWVTYRKDGEVYRIESGYSHRMTLEEGTK